MSFKKEKRGPRLRGGDGLQLQAARLSCARSTGARSRLAGPLMTWPCESKREPWQGQSHVFSPGFHCTMQPRCGQVAEQACTAPDASLYTAIFSSPWRTMAPLSGEMSANVRTSPGVTQSAYCAAMLRSSRIISFAALTGTREGE